MDIIEAFPKVIVKHTWDKKNHESLKRECYKIIFDGDYFEKNTMDENLNHYFLFEKKPNLYRSKLEYNLIDNINFFDFKTWIEQKSVCFFQEIMGYDIDDNQVLITECWLNKCDSGGKQFYHSHSNSFISGTYYVNYEKKLHAPITFRSTCNYNKSEKPYLSLKIKNKTKYNSEYCYFDYDEGDLLLWESNMIHGYDQNESDNRVSISFNVMPKYVNNGRYGFSIEKF
jgi:uncharacterized protein (TIGR02466 family)